MVRAGTWRGGWRLAALALLAALVLACEPVTLAPDPDAALATDGELPVDATGPALDVGRPPDAAPDALADAAPDEGPAITCAVTPELAEVAPLTPLVLAGPPGDAIRRWTWQITERPAGARPVLAEFFEGGAARPDFVETPQITFRGDRAGTYGLTLQVVGQGGAALCPPLQVAVRVRPPEGLYAQLTWTSPFDPCEACDDGVDLDLVMAPRDRACWGSGSTWTARPGDARDWPPEGSPEGDPGGVSIVEDGAGLEAMGVPTAPGLMVYALGVLAFDLTVDNGLPGPPAEWPADAVLALYWDGLWLGEFETQLSSTGQVQHLVDVFTCVGAGCRPDVQVVGRAGVWGTCAE